jgi:sulfatase modifying factor 1
MRTYFLLFTVLLAYCQTTYSQAPTGMVKVTDFYMDTCEVTVADFAKFVTATNYVTDAEKQEFNTCYGGKQRKGVSWRCNAKGKQRPISEYNRPVIFVSYNDAVAYCKWAKKRLPKASEWLAAVSMYPASQLKGKRIEQVARLNYDHTTSKYSGDVSPVGQLKPTSIGIYDLIGNVNELVDEMVVEGNNKYVKVVGSSWLGGEGRISVDKDYNLLRPTQCSFMTGFRCVKDI